MTKTSSRAKQVEWETRISFRNRLREGRTKALADAEDFVNIVQTLEELGQVLCGEHRSGLGKYERELQAFVVDSALAHDPARKAPDLHVPIDRLLRVVREGRNDAVHIGSFARKVVSHAIDLALIVEDAMVPEGTVADFLVRGIVTAEFWQPLSFIRRQMLEYSFSHLPVYSSDKGWQLVSDFHLAHYLRASKESRRGRLVETLRDGSLRGLKLEDAQTYPPETEVETIIEHVTARPVLVVRSPQKDSLIGIVTAFDLL